MKKYLDINVFDASIKRIEYILKEFDNVCISVSGGKDSSVMVQLFNMVAKIMDIKFDCLFIDLEADYQYTFNHIEELKKLSQINEFYHVCLPISINNGVSIFQPKWICWDKADKEKWIREMPKNVINEDNNIFDFYEHGMDWYSFLNSFSKWNSDKSTLVQVIGLRADESYYRFKAIAFGENKYKDTNYIIKKSNNSYNAYPIYDWSTEDIWHVVSKFDLMYNYAYELMNMNGLSIHDQRISQPFGNDQKGGLKLWASIENETWYKIVNRLSGVNMSALYAKTNLLGHNGSCKPNHLSWQEYALFLLESLGLYDEDLMIHYYKKIKIFFNYYKDKGVNSPSDIKDEMTKSEMEKLADNGKWIHWKRVAICIEKNDFACRTLTYGLTLEDKKDMIKLKSKWGKLLGIQENTKEMRNLKKELENENN